MNTQTNTPNITLQSKSTIKQNIKKIVALHPEKDLMLVCGVFDTKLAYTSKKDFGNKVLDFLSRGNVSDIVFKGIENNTLVFRAQESFNPQAFGNGRGYGQGRYMGD